MSVGDVAGLIAAVAFVLLVGALAIPLVKLGGVLDETRQHDQGRVRRDRPAAQRGHHHGDHDQRPAGPGRRHHLQRAGGDDQRLGAHRTVRGHPRRPGGQGRRLHLRRPERARRPARVPAPGARWPTRPGPSRPPRARRSGGRRSRCDACSGSPSGRPPGSTPSARCRRPCTPTARPAWPSAPPASAAVVRAFADEVRAGMAEREAELREALGMEPAHDAPLTPSRGRRPDRPPAPSTTEERR